MIMNTEQIEKYRSLIQDIIDSNKRFYGFENKVEWDFFENNDKAVFAFVKEDLKLYININSVIYSYEINEPLQIEYFILHEIRHIYQRRFIILYKTDPTRCSNSQVAQRYDYEFRNYIKPDNLEQYYSQQIELEAFLFSYSVMLYKHGVIDYIKLPSFLESIGAQQYVDSWIDVFKKQNL